MMTNEWIVGFKAMQPVVNSFNKTIFSQSSERTKLKMLGKFEFLFKASQTNQP